ncbi:MAG: hypothetical protein L0287_18110 [Anaerolineae bacterium]|nr:hypothetical protein [Anaerolineae bacterium]
MTSVIFILPRPASAQGLLGNSVLQLSPSAVANGMGNGFVAASTEASAIHYNPAALTRLGRFAIEGNTFELFQDARYHHVAGAFQIPFFNRLWLGAAYSRVGISESIVELNKDFEPVSKISFKSYERALSIAAAAKISHHASLGVAFKHARSGLDVGTESLRADPTYALDLGFLYEGILPVAHISWREGRQPLPSKNGAAAGLAPGFSLGVTLTNISLNSIFGDGATREVLTQIDVDPALDSVYAKPEIVDAVTDDFLLTKLRLGLAWNFFESNGLGLVATGEITKPLNEIANRCNGTFTGDRDENELTFAAGLEVNLLRLAAIRFGRHWGDISPRPSHSDGGFLRIPISGRNCRSEYDISYATFGFSIGPPGLRFSYAKILYDDNILLRDWQIYSASIVLDKLPWQRSIGP